MKLKIAKLFRILTVAPIMALAALCSLYAANSQFFGESVLNLALAIIFLTVLPLLAYPLQPIIPHFRGKGREGQRNLAMLFAVGGYIFGCVTNLFLNAPIQLWVIYLEYLLSGLLILIINKAFRLRASAHACGVAGPAVMLAYFGIPAALIIGTVLYVAAFWSSLCMKRHSWQQFVGGTVIPILVLSALHLTLML